LCHLPGWQPRLHLQPPLPAGRLSSPAPSSGDDHGASQGGAERVWGSELGVARDDELGLQRILSPPPLSSSNRNRMALAPGGVGMGCAWTAVGAPVARVRVALAHDGRAPIEVGAGAELQAGRRQRGWGGVGPGRLRSLAGGIAWPAAVLGGAGGWVGDRVGNFSFFLFKFLDFLVDLTCGSTN
jgi:hypothetical protein